MSRSTKSPVLFVVLAFHAQPVLAQTVLRGGAPNRPPVLSQGTLAALDPASSYRDLNCKVKPEQPILGLDLKFHTGYTVTVPMADLSGSGNRLAVVFRVTHSGQSDPVYMEDSLGVPPIPPDAPEDAGFTGAFDVGEGKYTVNWSVRDRAGRYCTASWEITAALPSREKDLPLALRQGAVQATERDLFRAEGEGELKAPGSLRVKVLMHFASEVRAAVEIEPAVKAALVSILRNISRDPGIGKLSVVGFNMQDQRVLFRQEETERIDFPGLGQSLQTVSPTRVSLHSLMEAEGGARFLVQLVKEELAGSGPPPDALIIAGPKAFFEGNLKQADLKELEALGLPVFYLNYSSDPAARPWRDGIGRMVKMLRGYEFNISGPRDLGRALKEVVTRTAAFRSARGSMGLVAR